MNEANNMGTGANYSKFVVDSSNPLGAGMTIGGDGSMGQSKYSGGTGKCMNDDPTRDTADDKKAEIGYEKMCSIDDESQGGMY